MKNEILNPVLSSDVEPIPRYRLVRSDGTYIADNVEIQLRNTIKQAGTPYDVNSVLTDDVATLLDLTPEATPNDAFKAIATKVYANMDTLSRQISENSAKIATLWDAVFTAITANPFTIIFTSLDGVTVTKGIYNIAMHRLEC